MLVMRRKEIASSAGFPTSCNMAGVNSRLIGLDVLRFIATSMVVFSHANGFGDAGAFFYKAPGLCGTILSLVPAGGGVAVVIFFVLSGFLVSGLLFSEAKKTGTVSAGRFLIRRAFKIYPAFWVMLGFTIVFFPMLLGAHISLAGLFAELFYYQNYKYALCLQTWTLAVEEHFYFLLAGLFWILKRRAGPGRKMNFDGIPDLFLFVAVLCLVSRFVVWLVTISYTNQNMYLFLRADYAVIDSLFFGTMLSHFWHNRWDDRVKSKVVALSWPLAVVALVLFLPAFWPVMDLQWYRILGPILIYLGAGCLLLSSLSLDFLRCPAFIRWLAWLGRYSYSVYLWHAFIGACVFPWFDVKRDSLSGSMLNLLVYFSLCWCLGIIMACIIEFPVLKIRDRWYPSLARS
jgi:peptidoglycan/LPS O-acetylase OafA/YrhL